MVILAVRSVMLDDPVDKFWDLCALWYMSDTNRDGYDFCPSKFTTDEMNYLQQLHQYIDKVKELPTVS